MKPRTIRSAQSVLLASFLVGTLTGCATNRISQPDRWAHATFPKSQTVWTFFWGAVEQDVRPPNCPGPGLSEVTVRSNYGFALISVLSLGIAMPVTIEWRAAKDCQPAGNNDGI